MEKQNLQPTEQLNNREAVWLHAWTAVARADNSYESNVATRWADECLKAFDLRFPKVPVTHDISFYETN